jgi:predicted secreted protein
VCTDSATEATNRLRQEGDQITRNLASRFGG